MKRRHYKRQHRNTKDHKTQLQVIICQKNGQPGRNGQIFRKVQSPKTEQGRNRKYEETNYKY